MKSLKCREDVVALINHVIRSNDSVGESFVRVAKFRVFQYESDLEKQKLSPKVGLGLYLRRNKAEYLFTKLFIRYMQMKKIRI